jgi:gamma-D-glutamyl-L-lysine dipeptidyl-peptidase
MKSSPARPAALPCAFQLFRYAAILIFSIAAPLQAKSNLQVVVVPVANMFAAPSDKSAVVSQAIYGSNVTLLIARGEWSKIQTDDHYKGWTPSRYLRLTQINSPSIKPSQAHPAPQNSAPDPSGYATSGPTVQVESLFANIYNEPDVTRHKPVITVPYETHLEVIVEAQGKIALGRDANLKNAAKDWLQVRLPDKRTAWIQTSDVISDPKPLSISDSIELAKHFLGLPYLWGGRSSFGFDCSGFTQMLIRARGANMPRDADQQAAWKGVAPVERNALQPGDLVFFGSAATKITHTGMYIGDGEFINATTTGHPVVQICRLDDDPWTRLLVACRRLK